jgi:translation initiation factor 3 subunit L
MHILKSLVRISSSTESEMHKSFGFFASIELARLECLIGDYTASLKAIEPIFRNEFTDSHTLFTQVPTCHINVYYHAGICYLMLRRYADALETYTEIILFISRILKPGSVAVRGGSQSQMTKMLEKILSLTAIITALCPGRRIDDQVRELMDAKLGQKLVRLNAGDVTAFSEMFEHTCPKFISPFVPDYSVPTNFNTEAFNTQINVFITEAAQQISVLKIRSYLRLYASIDVSKLARFNDVSESVFISQLVSFKHKTVQEQTLPGQAGPSEKGVIGDFLVSTSDVHYYLQGESVFIDTSSSKSDKTRAIERHFISGIRKHNETKVEIKKSFRKYGL